MAPLDLTESVGAAAQPFLGSAGTYRRAPKEGPAVDPEIARLVLEAVRAGFVLLTLVVLGLLI
jgi:hypothetical protein